MAREIAYTEEKGIVPLFPWQFINCMLYTWMQVSDYGTGHLRMGLQKVPYFQGKSTDVCIKEVRCFGFPDWGLVPTIGSDRDIANESAYDKQQYDANRNGIPSVTYLSQVEPRQGGLTTRYRVLWI